MEIYTVSGLLFQDVHFTCPDEAELYAAVNDGKVKTSELEDYETPICTTERNGEEITYKDYVFKINVELDDVAFGGQVVRQDWDLINITLNGKDINSFNFTEDFKRELEDHAENYLEQLREY